MLSSLLISKHVTSTFYLQHSVPSSTPVCSGLCRAFGALQINSLPWEKRQIIKIELNLANTTSDLRGFIRPFKNNQEMVYFLKIAYFPLYIYIHRASNCSERFQYHKVFWNVSLCIYPPVHDAQAVIPVWKPGDHRASCHKELSVPLFCMSRACNRNQMEASENEYNNFSKIQKWDFPFILGLMFSKESYHLCILHVVPAYRKINNEEKCSYSNRLEIWHALEYSNDKSNHSSTICFSLYVLNL